METHENVWVFIQVKNIFRFICILTKIYTTWREQKELDFPDPIIYMKSKAGLLVSTSFMLLVSCQALTSEVTIAKTRPNEMKVYSSKLIETESLSVEYLSSSEDLPYTSFHSFVEFYSSLQKDNDKLPTYEVFNNRLTNKNNNTYLEVNPTLESLTFSDFEEFATFKNDVSIFYPTYDTNHKDDKEDMRYTCYSHICTSEEDRSITISLKNYHIHTFKKNNEIYLPVSFYLDFILYPLDEVYVVGKENIFELDYSSWYNEMGNSYSSEFWKYYRNEFHDISASRLAYSENETRLAISLAYGQNKPADSLKKANSIAEAEDNLATYIYQDINELHSSYLSPSPYMVSSYQGFYHLRMKTEAFLNEKQRLSPVFNEYRDLYSSLSSLREKEKKAFEIKNNTAYITFNDFVGARKDYYDEDYVIDETNYTYDTISLMSYSYHQIKNNKNIDNIVFDVSLNTGGEIAAMVYAVGLFASSTNFYSMNSLNEATYHFSLHSDANFDGKMDDPILDKNIYVLSSGISFSCGNSFISLMKESAKATIVGQNSAGGASSIRYMLSPLGSQYRISSNEVMCDSSFQNLEKGIAPDISLNLSSLYEHDIFLTK